MGFSLLAQPTSAGALETQVFTGVFYYPSDAEKLLRAETERGEEGLTFSAPREPRDEAREFADEELRKGNVCLRQLKTGLKSSVKSWRAREFCDAAFHDSLADAIRAANKDKLHADHVECSVEAEVREAGGDISIWLAFRAQLVMTDRVPAKLRRAGIGGDVVRRDLPAVEDTLGSTTGTWKEALKAGACTADSGALDKFWDKLKAKAAAERELAECRNGYDSEISSIEKIQKQLRDYVPEEWVKERAGDGYDALMAPSAPMAAGAPAAGCVAARRATAAQLEKLRSLSSRIADKYDVPALSLDHSASRSPASVAGEDEE